MQRGKVAILSRNWLVWPVTLGFALRAAWALLIPAQPLSDSAMYHEFAQSIVKGAGYAFADGSLTAYWPVGTSATYALLYSIFGVHLEVVVMFQVILGTLTVLLTGLIARQALGERVGLSASWLVAIWPVLIQMTTVLASELLFTFLVMLALWIHQKSWPLLPRVLAWSTALALAIYVRPIAAPMVAILVLAEYQTTRDWRRALLGLLVAIFAISALTYPWKLRNEQLWGRSGVMSTNFGPNLWIGNNPRASGGYMGLPDQTFANELERDDVLRGEAVTYIARNPARYLALCARRVLDTFGRETIGVAWNEPSLVQRFGEPSLLPIKLVSTAYWIVVAILGLVGLIAWLRRSAAHLISPLMLVPALFAAASVLLVSQDRYHLPMNPFIAMFAAISLHSLSGWLAGSMPGRTRPAASRP